MSFTSAAAFPHASRVHIPQMAHVSLAIPAAPPVPVLVMPTAPHVRLRRICSMERVCRRAQHRTSSSILPRVNSVQHVRTAPSALVAVPKELTRYARRGRYVPLASTKRRRRPRPRTANARTAPQAARRGRRSLGFAKEAPTRSAPHARQEPTRLTATRWDHAHLARRRARPGTTCRAHAR